MSYSGLVAACEHRRHLGRPDGVLERYTNGWTSSACRTTAHRINHHHHRTAARREQTIYIFGGAGFLNAILSKIGTHGSKELFWVGHDLIVPSTAI